MEFNDLSLSKKHENLSGVLDTMTRYNRSTGWMRWDGDKMRFYDGEVEEGIFVEIGLVRFWVSEFK